MYNFTLYMTTDCNFKCQYCYEDYHNHYQLNEKTLVDSLEFMMNYGDRGKVLIDFLGGEPLLKKDLIYKAVAYIKDNYPEREVKYYITTNCSMMDDRFIAFMKENHFTVRLSFDGNKETHDLNRVAKDGVSCYEKIFENIMKVKDSGLNFSVRMTVTENTIPYMFENICYLHEHVSQEDFLFTASVRENLKMGNEEISDEEMIEISRKMGVHQFVSKMEREYDSVLEERGKNLSKGQRQKLSLTRAILRHPKILILDEATSNMDSISEREILNYIKGIRDITLILISHRINVIADSDCIYVLQKGNIVARGTDEQLKEQCELYRQLYGEEEK